MWIAHTARKYIEAGKCPAELQARHTWRTRPDPLEKVWAEVTQMLRDAPELEAKTLFEYFLARPDSGLEESHGRTFSRRVRQWRATHGPEREVFFAQDRNPGQLLQLDWTYARELKVTIQGEELDHLFCHCVLPYSDWEWATRCISESFLSLVSGLQGALAQLGKSPWYLGTDNSSAATHELEQIPGRPRGFNSDYLELCTHYDLTPLTIHVGCPHEQGDVESQNRHLKRRLEQHLILRGSRDFASLEDYDRFVVRVLRAANAKRQKRLAQELACMRPLPAGRLAEYKEYEPVVSSQSLIRVKRCTYSVPSRLIGHTLRVELHEAELKVYLGREFLFCSAPAARGLGASGWTFATSSGRYCASPELLSIIGTGRRFTPVRYFARLTTDWWPTTANGRESSSICRCSSWRRSKRWKRSSRRCRRAWRWRGSGARRRCARHWLRRPGRSSNWPA